METLIPTIWVTRPEATHSTVPFTDTVKLRSIILRNGGGRAKGPEKMHVVSRVTTCVHGHHWPADQTDLRSPLSTPTPRQTFRTLRG